MQILFGKTIFSFSLVEHWKPGEGNPLLLAEPVTEANAGYTLFMDSEAEVIG